jgi:heat shock protein HslJ
VATELRGQEIDPPATITLMFVASQFAGRIGCLVYDGAIQTATGGEILDLRPFGGYDGACGDHDEPPVPVNDYFSALESAARYRLSGDRLEFVDTSGETVLAFRPGIPDGGELLGTAWQLRTLDGAAPIAGTTITLEFNESWLVGDSGCNSYGGQYMLIEPGVISIAAITSTLVGCADPPGVHDQETTYQQTLQQIVSYELTGTELHLLDAEGVVRLVFEQTE